MKAVYIRTSTSEQDTARQKQNTDAKIYEDKISGAIPFAERIQGKKLINDIRAKKINEVEVSSLSRLGRKMTDLINLIDFFDQYKVNLIVKDLGLNSYSGGKKNKMFSVVSLLLANMAEMQREEMLESQAQAIAIKRAKGLNYHDSNRKKEDTAETLNKYKNVIKDLKKGVKDAQILKTNYVIYDRNYLNATDKEKTKMLRPISRNTLKKIKNLRII